MAIVYIKSYEHKLDNLLDMKAHSAYETVNLKDSLAFATALIYDKVERSFSNLCFQFQSVK